MNTKINNTKLMIRQQTDYPCYGRILLSISPERELRFPLKLRIPHWSAKNSVQVNGQPVPDVNPGNYLVLDRFWKKDDTIQIDLDMSLHFWVGERESEGKTSIYRGPILMVYEVTKNTDKVVPEFDTKTMNERIVSDNSVLLQPLIMMEFTDINGNKIKLRDYGKAGYAGAYYYSWLKVQHIEPEQFTRLNPLRSSRTVK